MLKGSCLCGATEFTISGELRSPRYCHCTNCRKFAGTSPATWAMAKTTALELTSSSAGISKFNSGRGFRCFCSSCGSPLWFESLDYPEITAIPLGALDEGEIPEPQMHLWVQSIPKWCAITDALPQHQTNP